MQPEFDNYSDEYNDIMDDCVGVFGQEAEYFQQYKSEYLQRIANGITPAKILDFGCGVGNFSNVLAKTFPTAEVHGYDVSSKSIDIARKSPLHNVSFSSNLGDLDERYDLVVVANVMHHIPPNQRESAIDEIWSRVRTDGQVIVFEHNPLNPLTRWVVKHCAFDADAILLKPRETTGYFLRRKASVRRDYIVFFPKMVSWLKPLEPALMWLPLGAQYAVVAQK